MLDFLIFIIVTAILVLSVTLLPKLIVKAKCKRAVPGRRYRSIFKGQSMSVEIVSVDRERGLLTYKYLDTDKTGKLPTNYSSTIMDFVGSWEPVR